MTEWHTYRLEWYAKEAHFWVDERHLSRVSQPPCGPLGFVAWLDNQYAIATPRGVLRFGTVSCEPQWFELGSVSIAPFYMPVYPHVHPYVSTVSIQLSIP